MSFPEKLQAVFDKYGTTELKIYTLLNLYDDVLDCYAEDQKELIKTILKELDIIDEFTFLVKEYALVDNSKLTKDAIELKLRILKALEIGQEEHKQKLLQYFEDEIKWALNVGVNPEQNVNYQNGWNKGYQRAMEEAKKKFEE